MPKSFSEAERQFIHSRLMEETRHCLALYGIRKTTVEALVKRVSIPKGTFYLFFESKERLIFEVILRFHDEIQENLLKAISVHKTPMSAAQLTDIIFGLYKTLENSFFPKLLADGELAFFMGKLPPELSKLHADEDMDRFGALMALLPGINPQNMAAYSAALRGVFLTLLFRKELGEAVFDDALRIMIQGIVMQLFEKETT